jgi:zinc transport system permease protein
MMEFLHAVAEHAFLQYALLTGMLASIGCGIMGTYVVVRRITFLAGGIAHAVLGGMGIAYFLGYPPIAGAIAASLVAALLIGWVSLRWEQHEDTLIGALWAVGMAVGILFISKTPGYSVDLMSYLFGNILMVPQDYLYLMAALDGFIVLMVALFHKQFLAVAFDEEFARLRGVPVALFYLLLLCLVALTVVLLIQVVGLILVIALLTLPAAIAVQYAGSLGRIMVIATGLGAAFTSGGLALSYQPDLPSGPMIVLLAALAYLLSTVGAALVGRWRMHRQRIA